MDHNVPRVVLSCNSKQFFWPGSENGEIKSQTKVQVHRFKWCRLVKSLRNTGGGRFTQASSTVMAFWKAWIQAPSSVSGGLTGPATGFLRLTLIGPCGLGKAASSAPLSPAHPWAGWAPSGADQSQPTPKSFPPHNLCLLSPLKDSLPCSYLRLNAEDLSRFLHLLGEVQLGWGSTWMPHM